MAKEALYKGLVFRAKSYDFTLDNIKPFDKKIGIYALTYHEEVIYIG